jgi:replicative superfamily II helicase
MDYIMRNGKVVLYASPLKALTQEKYDDWQKRFPNKKIAILTSDYVLSEGRKKELAQSEIIVLTSEMLDSRTRRMESEKNYWLMKAGLLIVDESHILSISGRGHAVETGIMRFTKLNSRCRILFLSATMPNVNELGEWLTSLNGKKTRVIFSQWRPVELQFHYNEYPISINNWGHEDYWASQEKKRSMAVEIALSKPDEKFLIFCHDKSTGRNIVSRLRKAGIENAVFHNADLDLKERLDIENSFQDRKGGIRVLVSTSTLAWGRNLPARNVIIVGVHRGLDEVDQLDIIQMAGRAGRHGIDDEGHVYLIIPEGSTQAWQEVFRNPRPVTSVLNNHTALAFHVLAEIHSREIDSVHSLMRWYSRSLACRQGVYPFSTEDARALMEDLEKMEMIGYSGVKPFVTGLGKVSAWLYFSPYDIYAWYKNFKLVIERDLLDDITLAWALGDIPSNDLGYIPKEVREDCYEWRWILRNRGIQASDALPSIVAINHALTGVDMDSEIGLLKAIRRGIIFDIDRVVSALSLIDEMYAKWGKRELWSSLPIRIKYGIPDEMVKLVKIPGIGGKRARKLWDKGF